MRIAQLRTTLGIMWDSSQMCWGCSMACDSIAPLETTQLLWMAFVISLKFFLAVDPNSSGSEILTAFRSGLLVRPDP